MKFLKSSLVAALLVSGFSTLAIAEDKKSSISVSGDATIVSDYIWRGTTQTENTPTVQSTLGVEHESGVYVGTWLSGYSHGAEIDLYAGYATEIAGFGLDIGYLDYLYTYTGTKAEYDNYSEIYLGVSKSVMDIDLGATVYKGIINMEDSLVIEGSIDKDFGVLYVGAVGGYQVDDASGPNYYSATVGKSFESVKGDLSLTVANTTADDNELVYALAYTTSF
jgi:uncharacterized protein (TIGR02001 family)